MPDDPLSFDRDHVWHPYAPSPGPRPNHEVADARGVRLRLADGRELIDGMASWWSAIHGYRHPLLDDALADQAGRMAHVMFGGLTHRPALDLAERLLDLAPPGLTRVFFADSGSVAVEVALKMAIQCAVGEGRPERKRFVTVRGGYHGDTFGAMSVCDPVNGMHQLFTGAVAEQLFAPVPSPVFGAPWDPSHLDGVRTLLEAHAHEVAAVILEPIVQGAGGMRFYAAEFLAGVRALCDQHEVLLIADEIATAFGRTGRMFACEHADVAPDIACVGKALTGGYLTLAATLCTDRVASSVSSAGSGALMHGPTFMANPMACAVAGASLDVLTGTDWAGEVRRIERGLVDGLAPARDLPGVADVRVLGAIGVIETTDPVTPAVQDAAVAQGVWLRPFGHLIYTLPPYVIDDADLAAVTTAMLAAARALVGSVGRSPTGRATRPEGDPVAS